MAALKDQVAAGIEEPTPDGRTATQQLAEITERAGEPRRPPGGGVPRRAGAGARRRRASRSSAGPISTTPTRSGSPRSTSSASSRCSPRSPSTPATRSRTSPTSPSASPRWSPTPRPARTAASPGSRCRRCSRASSRSTSTRFVPVEDLIIAQLHTLFAGMVIEEAAAFRVTRNADLTVEDEEADDLLEAVEMELRRRRFNRAVRLEVSETHERRDARAAGARARAAPGRRLPAAAARSTSASCGSCTASTVPTSRTGRGRR